MTRKSLGPETQEFVGNTAELSGGRAAYVVIGRHVSWTGDTSFTSNEALVADGDVAATTALASGGRKQHRRLDPRHERNHHLLQQRGRSKRRRLSSAGGMYSDCRPRSRCIYIGNSAAVAGAAIFLSGTSGGPAFTDVSLVSNSAEIGGAVSLFGSGTKEPGDHPTTFDWCRFIGNRAAAKGGAINSAAGKDSIFSSVFEGNSAGTGGALRLAGTTSVYNCSFVENSSDDGEGAAVSNIGYIAMIENISFSSDGFDCPSGMFLDYNAVRSFACVRYFDGLATRPRQFSK